MSIGASVRQRLVDSQGSVGDRARQRRWDMVTAVFPDLAEMDVIDLGGRVSTWLSAPVRPRSVHVVNLEQQQDEADDDSITAEYGDACELPEHVRSRGYDAVFSNSVLEHVGGHERRQRFVPDPKSTRLNSSHVAISYAVFCLKKKNNKNSLYFAVID